MQSHPIDTIPETTCPTPYLPSTPSRPSTSTFTSTNLTIPMSTPSDSQAPTDHARQPTRPFPSGAIDSPSNPFRMGTDSAKGNVNEGLLPLHRRSPPSRAGIGMGSGTMGIGMGYAGGFMGYAGDASNVRDQVVGLRSQVQDGKGMEGEVEVGESRYLLITNLDNGADPEDIKRKLLDVTPFKALVFAHLKEHGSIILILYDPRSALLVNKAVREGKVDFCAANSSHQQDMIKLGVDRREQVVLRGLREEVVTSMLDGQHIKRIMAENEAGMCITMDANGRILSETELQVALKRYGELRNLRPVGQGQAAFLAEFYDSRESQGVIQELHNRRYADTCLFLSPMTIDWKAPSNIVKDSALLYGHYLHFTQDPAIASLLMTGLSRLPAPTSAQEIMQVENNYGQYEHGHLDRGRAHEEEQPQASSSTASQHAPIGKYLSPQARLQAQMAALGQGMSPSAVVENNPHLSWRKQKQAFASQPETPERPTAKSTFSPSSGSGSGGAFSGSSASSISPYSLDEVRRQRKYWEDREADLLATPSRREAEAVAVAGDDSPGSFSGRSRYSSNSSTPLVNARTYNRYANLLDSADDSASYSPKRRFMSSVCTETRNAVEALYKENVPPGNRLSLKHLLEGRDKRTTVMIKDVPNKLTRQQLINAIEEVVPGEVDFVYLRFDFANKCNVAYAFVNFTTTDALTRFAVARLGQKWNVYMSEKICQMSYANIQGRDSLITHFRNSTVMEVTEEWRPLLLSRGRPVPFPEPTHSRSLHRPSPSSTMGPTRSFITKGAFTIDSYDRPSESRTSAYY